MQKTVKPIKNNTGIAISCISPIINAMHTQATIAKAHIAKRSST